MTPHGHTKIHEPTLSRSAHNTGHHIACATYQSTNQSGAECKPHHALQQLHMLAAVLWAAAAWMVMPVLCGGKTCQMSNHTDVNKTLDMHMTCTSNVQSGYIADETLEMQCGNVSCVPAGGLLSSWITTQANEINTNIIRSANETPKGQHNSQTTKRCLISFLGGWPDVREGVDVGAA